MSGLLQCFLRLGGGAAGAKDASRVWYSNLSWGATTRGHGEVAFLPSADFAGRTVALQETRELSWSGGSEGFGSVCCSWNVVNGLFPVLCEACGSFF